MWVRSKKRKKRQFSLSFPFFFFISFIFHQAEIPSLSVWISCDSCVMVIHEHILTWVSATMFSSGFRCRVKASLISLMPSNSTSTSTTCSLSPCRNSMSGHTNTHTGIEGTLLAVYTTHYKAKTDFWSDNKVRLHQKFCFLEKVFTD